MRHIKRFSFALAIFCFSGLPVSAQAQTPGIEVVADNYQAQFSVQGEAREMRVEIFSPSGEIVFDSGTTIGRGVAWNMRSVEGQRVADGVYLATISIKETSGKIRKRIEQITLRSEQQQSVPAQAPNAVEATITGSGTSGKIAKFTGASTIGDSLITEGTNRIGINGNPTATLLVSGVQPVASANNGTNASTLLQTSGGKGGNTITSGKTAGKGASISLSAGNGGNAVSGSTNGNGGSITIQPGSGGTGGTGGQAGNVLLAPTDGFVGIGTNNPGLKLMVSDTSTGATIYGENNGSGTGVVGFCKGGTGVSGGSTSGNGVVGNSDSGDGVHGISSSDSGVFGGSGSGDGVHGFSNSGRGVYGSSTSGYAGYFNGKVGITGSLGFGATTRQMLNLYNATYGIGVQTNTLYSRTNVGFAWYKGGTHSNTQNDPGAGGTILMRVDSLGNAFANSFNPTSDRHMKTNFSHVNSRLILNRLAAIPIQTWNYKSEETGVRHIGPMAQDFRAAFNLGTDDKHISTVDADGVTMAAIQGLYQLVQEKDRRIEQQSRQIAELQIRLSQVERAIKKRRTMRRN